jgi:FkbM family methyltransferase
MAVFANDFISVKIATEGVFERLQLESLIALLGRITGDTTQTMTVLDVGANIGNHALFFSRYFSRVVAFEPHPVTYQLLAFNAQFRPNITTHNFGLGDKAQTLELHEDALNAGASSAIHGAQTSSHDIPMQVKRLDDVCRDLGPVDLVKIDVEGMEHGVLLGGAALIEAQKPVIVFEQLAQEFTAADSETPAIRLLKSWGYTLFWFEPDQKPVQWFLLGIPNLIAALKGREVAYNLTTRSVVPRATYDMLIALPPRYASQVEELAR